MTHEREIRSLANALSAVRVVVVETRLNRHYRIKIRHELTGACGNITLSASPSDINVQRQRERQIRKELVRLGVDQPHNFSWRQI